MFRFLKPVHARRKTIQSLPVQNLSSNPETFRFYSLCFTFSAREPFVFPPILSANVFRGAFGLMLRQVSADAYHEIFAPVAPSRACLGLADPPRPFVFRTRHLDGRTIEASGTFELTLNLFCVESDLIADVTRAFAEMGHTGFGPQRSRADLISSTHQVVSVPFSAAEDVEQLRIEFLTPTELKSNNQLLQTPDFVALISRAHHRISTLRDLYGLGPLELDFEAMSRRAATISLTRSETHHVKASRRSSRTAQVHPLGGFVGFAEYAGALTEFLPMLEIAAHTGIGRQTVWGKGEISRRRLA